MLAIDNLYKDRDDLKTFSYNGTVRSILLVCYISFENVKGVLDWGFMKRREKRVYYFFNFF